MTYGEAEGAHGPGGGGTTGARGRDFTLGMSFGLGVGLGVGIAFDVKPGARCRDIATSTPDVNKTVTKKPAGLETYGCGNGNQEKQGPCEITPRKKAK